MVYGSIYGASRIGLQEGSFDPKYAGPNGPDLMVQEAFDIDQKMFDLVIEHDFLECAAMNSVELESTLVAVDESFAGDMWTKIKELIKKVKDKIVSIAKAAAVKLNAFFTRDNAALVDRYGKQYDAAQKDKIEIKNWREFDANVIDASKINASEIFDKAANVTTAEGKKQFEKDYSADKMLRMALGDRPTTLSSFSKDAKEKSFGNAKTVKASNIDVKSPLTNYSSSVETINKAKEDMQTQLDGMDRDATKYEQKANSETDEEKKKTLTAGADCARYVVNEASKAYGKVFSAQLEVLKENMKQCRKAFITIASKGAGSVRESVEDDLLEAEIDLQDYAVDSFFEQDSYDFEELTA